MIIVIFSCIFFFGIFTITSTYLYATQVYQAFSFLAPMEDYESVVTEFSKLIRELEELITIKENLAHQVQTLLQENSTLKSQISTLRHEVASIQSSSLDHHHKEMAGVKSQLCNLLKKNPDGYNDNSLGVIIKSLEGLVHGLEERIKRQSGLERILKSNCMELEKKNKQARDEMMLLKSNVNDMQEENARINKRMKLMGEDMKKLEAAAKYKGSADGLSFLFVTVFFMVMSLLWLRYVERR